MDRPSKKMLARMPLAEGVLLVWRWVTHEEQMERLWQNHRGRCYQKIISFSSMVHLIADALLNCKGSGRRAFENAINNNELDASVQAAFKKLGRLPVSVSQAFLTECTASLRQAFPEWAKYQLPESLRSFRVLILDGKAIKRVAKRLKPLRGISGGLLGGRALVGLDFSTGLAVAMHAHEDGEANDVRFVPDLLPVLRDQFEGNLLYMGDRAFCDLTQPQHFTANEGDHFLVRYHKKNQFSRDKSRAQRKGKDASGRKYVESWGELGSVKNKHRRYVRMIQLELPDKAPLILVTDLLDADVHPAQDLLWLYAQRWGIEQVFQNVTEVFGLEHLIGGSPKACIFQFSFCMLLHNLIQLIRAYVAEAHDIEPEDISLEKLFEDVNDQLIAWNVMLEPEATIKYFRIVPSLPKLETRLRELFSLTWSERWRKSPPQERPKKKVAKKARTHNSVYRILRDHTQRKPNTKPRSP